MDAATATPSASTGSTTTGPASFSDLPSSAWNDASSASSPSPSETPAASAGAATTEPPAATTTEGSPQQGAPPQERWPDILNNARTKAREEVAQQWKDYEFIRQIPAQDAREFYELAVQSQGDPIALLNLLSQRIAADPVHGQALRSFAAKQLAAARGTAQSTEMPGPDLEVTDPQGNVISRTYSDQQLARLIQHVQKQTIETIEQKFAPVQQTHEAITRAQAQLQEQAQAQSWSADLSKDFNTWPGFHPEHNKAERAQVKTRTAELVAAMPREKQNDPVALENAFLRAYREVVVPTLSQRAESQLLDSLKTKAAASISVNPGTAAASTQRRVDRFDQLPPEAWR